MAKFKKGDRFRLSSDYSPEDGIASPGDTGDIVKYIQEGFYEVKLEKMKMNWHVHEEYLEPYEESLPEKWCIERTYDNCDEINKWFRDVSVIKYADCNGYMHYPSLHNNNAHYYVRKQEGYTEITLEQFRKITQPAPEPVIKVGMQFKAKGIAIDVVLTVFLVQESDKTVHVTWNNGKYGNFYSYEEAVKRIKEGDWILMDNKKIIGYKAPMDLYGGKLLKGEVVYRMPGTSDYVDYVDLNTITLPKEIVETWEPVYEPEETILKLGDKQIEVSIGRGCIKADGSDFSYPDARTIYVNMNMQPAKISGYNVNSFIKIGCCTFSFSDIKQIIDTYDKINSNEDAGRTDETALYRYS